MAYGGWAAARNGGPMIALFLLLVIAAIALGIVGVVAKGLLFLLIIGIVVFLGALTLAALRMRRRPGRQPARQPGGARPSRTASGCAPRAGRRRRQCRRRRWPGSG